MSNLPHVPAGLISQISSPLVSRERFAEMVFGTSEAVGIVIGWCNKGLIPCISIGKYSLINVALLQNRCLAKEFE